MKTIWVATANSHKLEEISAILGPNILLKSFKDLVGAPEVEENGHTYRENALIKARALFDLVHEPIFADDSGLEVDFLHGRPGIHSARFSGSDTNHERNIKKLLAELGDVPVEKRTARFRCVIAYLDETGKDQFFEGIFHGHIAFSCSGIGGFGYDPVFIPQGHDCSVAELSSDEKNSISHRSLAVEKLKIFLGL